MVVALIGMVVDIGSRFDFHGVRLAWLETFLDLMLRYRDKSQYRVSPTKARTMITWNKFRSLVTMSSDHNRTVSIISPATLIKYLAGVG